MADQQHHQSSSLTKKQIDECHEAFSNNDAGIISTKDLGTALRSLRLNPTRAQLKELVEIVDPHGVGIVNFKKLLAITDSATIRMTTEENNVDGEEPRQLVLEGANATILMDENAFSKERLMEAFEVFDPYGTGYISATYSRHIITSMREPVTTDEEADKMVLDALVFSRKGNINYMEYIRWMLSSGQSNTSSTITANADQPPPQGHDHGNVNGRGNGVANEAAKQAVGYGWCS
jgi:Ca2+-binding EF-hand superfamily protein